ncbi:MAG: hypothetical protein ACI4V1_00090 [Eubacteriales bacterium]
MKSKRIVTLLLALLMTAGTLLACAEDPVETETGTHSADTPAVDAAPAETEAETIDENVDENGYLLDDLPDDLDFGGQTINLLYWSDVENQEFEADEFTGEIVNDAIYQRNLNVEDDLNVSYNWIGTPGNGSNIDAYVAKVRESHSAGDRAYDIYASYSRTIAASVINGFTTNLETAPYLDYDKPWWPDNLLAESTINNRLYFVSGDISTNVLHMMYCVYYNKQLLEDYQLEDPTDLVFENQWTLDKLVEMTTDAYVDLNGNAKKDVADQFGFTIVNYHNDAFYTGSDLKLVEKDPEKVLIISPDFYSEKSVGIIEKLGPWEVSNDVYQANDYETPFTEGRALFNINRAHYASKALRDSELTYGIVPVPKYDEAQAEFRTVMGNPVTLYAIALNCEYKDVCCAVLECMASNGYRLTTPAIFENNMKKKYSVDDINAQMYDIVRESVSFELGRFFNKYLSNITDLFFAAVESNSQTWASTSARYQKPLTKNIEKIVESILENEQNLE